MYLDASLSIHVDVYMLCLFLIVALPSIHSLPSLFPINIWQQQTNHYTEWQMWNIENRREAIRVLFYSTAVNFQWDRVTEWWWSLLGYAPSFLYILKTITCSALLPYLSNHFSKERERERALSRSQRPNSMHEGCKIVSTSTAIQEEVKTIQW